MITVSIIGSGNVATHLYQALVNASSVALKQVYGRDDKNLTAFSKAETITDMKLLTEVDVFLVAVKDDAVQPVIEQLSAKKGIVAHTSGSNPLLTSATNNGVFYPLQTFSKQKAVDFSKIPLCIEADTHQNYAVLNQLAKRISQSVYPISTEQRKSLHLSAVFVCNFVNHLYSIGEDLCTQNQVPFEILRELIAETADKAQQHSPANVQTGPAIRHDEQTIADHLAQLSPDYAKIYTLLTKSIQKKHG